MLIQPFARRSSLAPRIAAGVVPWLLAVNSLAQPPQDGEKPAEEKRGLRVHDSKAFDGYTLICPLMSLRTVLLDMDGRIVKEWKSDLPPGNNVLLLENGNVLRAERIEDGGTFEGGGIGGKIQEFTWDGELVWDYRFADEKRHHHHDFKLLPNGHFLIIAWERKSGTAAIQAGRDPALMDAGEFWPDAVFELEKDGKTGAKIVWEWHTWDHLIQDFDKGRDNFGDVAAHPELVDINGDRNAPKGHGPRPPGPPDHADPSKDGGDAKDGKSADAKDQDKLRQAGYLGGAAKDAKGKKRNVQGADWMHTNAIDYDPATDEIIISVKNFCEFWILDHGTTTAEAKGHTGGKRGHGGDLLFRFGNPKAYRGGSDADEILFHQHNPQWIHDGLEGAGHILVFNNGAGRKGEPFSMAMEFALPTTSPGVFDLKKGVVNGPKDAVWSYGGGKDEKFFSSFISGVQRLPNGNTLICSGEQGRIFEVTKKGEIVWEYWNEVGGDAPKKTPDGGPGGPPPAGAGGPGGPGGGPPPGGPPGGPGAGPPGGGINPFALFRATRIAKDHPGLKGLVVPAH